jgi:hypothetical protein
MRDVAGKVEKVNLMLRHLTYSLTFSGVRSPSLEWKHA